MQNYEMKFFQRYLLLFTFLVFSRFFIIQDWFIPFNLEVSFIYFINNFEKSKYIHKYYIDFYILIIYADNFSNFFSY